MKSVQSSDEYFIDLLKEIRNAKKRVYLQSMLFESGGKIEKIEDELIKASKKGLDVRINYDWVADKYVDGNLSKFPAIEKEKRELLNKLHTKNQEMHKRLESSGVKLSKTNDPSFLTSAFPYLGRSHIKTTIIDDSCCWVGGVNLTSGSFDNIDVMVKSNKKNLISALIKLFYEINEYKNAEDYSVKIDDKETLFIDVGNINKSIIYEKAKEVINSAKKSIVFMSQFVPDSKLLGEIEKISEHGVETKIITSNNNDPIFTKYPEKLTYVMLKKSIEDRHKIELIHLSRKVHAKIILVDNRVVLYGSHNYIYSGVLFGTAEIMIENSEEKIINEFKEYLENIS